MFFNQFHLYNSPGKSYFRIPSAIATKKGTVLLFCNNRLKTVSDNAPEKELVMCRKPLNSKWSEMTALAGKEGFDCGIGSAVYDENTDKILCLFARTATSDEAKALVARGEIATGSFVAESTDDGLTWTERPITVEPNAAGYKGYTHGSSAGVTLRHGKHAGRLLLPARYMRIGGETVENLQNNAFNCTIYSDDHGLTWKTGGAVQAGTGEGTLAELDDGTIYYNSRAYFFDGPRRIAYSYDGGETFTDFKNDEHLVEPVYGNNASLLSLKLNGKSALVFANADFHFLMNPPDDNPLKYVDKQRKRMTVQISWDNGRTWSIKKCLHDHLSAYSSLVYCSANGHFYLFYESGTDRNIYERMTFAEFDLEWLMS